MAVQDDPYFQQWDEASAKFALRELAFKCVSETHPHAHPLYKHAKAQLKAAKARLDNITSKL
jgi:hypothetical protein